MPKKITYILLLVYVLSACAVFDALAEVSPAEEKQIIKKYLEKLAADKLIELRLNQYNDFDKSIIKLSDNIRKALPKYYRLKKSGSLAVLSPTRPQMFFKYGDYAGSVELPTIECSDFPKPVELVTRIINDVLPSYQNEDNNIKVIFRDATMRVTNKTGNTLKLNKITLYHNGTFVDNIVDSTLELAPAAMSEEIALTSIIEQNLGLIEKHHSRSAQEAQQVKINFGFGVVYEVSKGSPQKMLSLVNTFSLYELTRNTPDTARLESHMASLAAGNVLNGNSGYIAGGYSVSKPLEVDVASEKQYRFKIEFDFGKVSIQKKDLDRLENIGQAMKKYPHIKGIVEGHTDNIGGKETNQRISELRAKAAKEYLVRTYAIDPGRIEVKGYGMIKAIADNRTTAGRAKNRRIEGRFRGLNE